MNLGSSGDPLRYIGLYTDRGTFRAMQGYIGIHIYIYICGSGGYLKSRGDRV